VEVKAASFHVGAQDAVQVKAATIAVRTPAAATNAQAKAADTTAELDVEERPAYQQPVSISVNSMAPHVPHLAPLSSPKFLCPRYLTKAASAAVWGMQPPPPLCGGSVATSAMADKETLIRGHVPASKLLMAHAPAYQPS